MQTPWGDFAVSDAHVHFFSRRFFEALGSQGGKSAEEMAGATGWVLPPQDPAELARAWAQELDAHGVARAALIASIPGDEDSVATAVRRHASRFVGFFMFNPVPGGIAGRLSRALGEHGLRGICLFPAMHGYRLDDERVKDVFAAAADHGAVVFAHCGVLTVGVRKKLGLPSPFDLRFGDPLALAAVASRFPAVPVIVPHFGAGMLREALMAVEQCATIHLDTSSSNGWMKYYPGLTLEQVFHQAIVIAGPERILFGTDSSFFPRGWQQPIFAAEDAALRTIGAAEADRHKIFGGNFDRLFPG
jgi:predicted TIM-barrel fold metal-dependent hydrolase